MQHGRETKKKPHSFGPARQYRTSGQAAGPEEPDSERAGNKRTRLQNSRDEKSDGQKPGFQESEQKTADGKTRKQKAVSQKAAD
ncbi:hypothetical protein K160097B7_36600 [[Clostridium] hylemonae]|nr:hypothetical protein CE91St63_35700 [[Clostridium] hylemonae]